jgi:hypothetical protein
MDLAVKDSNMPDVAVAVMVFTLVADVDLIAVIVVVVSLAFVAGEVATVVAVVLEAAVVGFSLVIDVDVAVGGR